MSDSVVALIETDWYFVPLAQSAQYSEAGSFPGSGKRAGVWHWHDRLWRREEMLQVGSACFASRMGDITDSE